MAHALSAGHACSSRVDEAPGPQGPHGSLSLADDPSFVAALDDLDRGVFEHGADTRTIAPRSPLIAQLVVPGAQAIEQRHLLKARRARVSKRRAGISAWAACWIILAMLSGVSAAGFTFHARLSEILQQWEGSGSPNGAVVLNASVR